MGPSKQTENSMNKLTYAVTSDWIPYRVWIIRAESEIEARQVVAAQLQCPLDHLEATLAAEVCA
jgi:hypothetical protein